MEESITEAQSSEYEPSELKELLKNMGVQQGASQPSRKLNLQLSPLNLMTIIACGAVVTAAEVKVKAASCLDNLIYNSSLGTCFAPFR